MKRRTKGISFITALLMCVTLFFGAGTAAADSVLQPGDLVTFGEYPQGADGTMEPIQWRVLAVDGDKALVITEQVIDAMSFSTKSHTWWANSDIREWMNGDFIRTAFTDAEQGTLIETEIHDTDDEGKETVTQDYFFALTNEEAEQYFSSDSERKASPTAYTRGKNIHYADGACWWWLRSKSDMYHMFKDVHSQVETDGSIYVRGASADRKGKDNIGVRPAGWVRTFALTGGVEPPGPSGISDTPEPTPDEPEPPEASAQAADGEGTLIAGVNPAYALSYGCGVLMGRQYAPDYDKLFDLELLEKEIKDGQVSVKVDPFLIVVHCEKDPERAEQIDLCVSTIDEKISADLAYLYGRYMMEVCKLSEEQALSVMNELLNAGNLQDGVTTTLNGYDFTIRLNTAAEYPIQFILGVHGEETAPVPAGTGKAEKPEKNLILFRGMPYGITYAEFCGRMEADGLTSSGSTATATSWEVYYKQGDMLSESKLTDGGFKYTAKNIPEDFSVAGFKVSSLTAVFLKAFDENDVYEEMEKATLLKATYTFSVTDVHASYDILAQKLTALYGPGTEENYHTGWNSTGGDYDEYVTITTWRGDGNTGVYLVKHYEIYEEGSRPKEQSLWLCYGASNSVQMIEGLRAAIAREELEKSSDMSDMSGL